MSWNRYQRNNPFEGLYADVSCPENDGTWAEGSTEKPYDEFTAAERLVIHLRPDTVNPAGWNCAPSVVCLICRQSASHLPLCTCEGAGNGPPFASLVLIEEYERIYNKPFEYHKAIERTKNDINTITANKLPVSDNDCVFDIGDSETVSERVSERTATKSPLNNVNPGCVVSSNIGVEEKNLKLPLGKFLPEPAEILENITVREERS